MGSGERPISAAKGKQSDTEALCQAPPPPPPLTSIPAMHSPRVCRGRKRFHRPIARRPGPIVRPRVRWSGAHHWRLVWRCEELTPGVRPRAVPHRVHHRRLSECLCGTRYPEGQGCGRGERECRAVQATGGQRPADSAGPAHYGGRRAPDNWTILRTRRSRRTAGGSSR